MKFFVGVPPTCPAQQELVAEREDVVKCLSGFLAAPFTLQRPKRLGPGTLHPARLPWEVEFWPCGLRCNASDSDAAASCSVAGRGATSHFDPTPSTRFLSKSNWRMGDWDKEKWVWLFSAFNRMPPLSIVACLSCVAALIATGQTARVVGGPSRNHHHVATCQKHAGVKITNDLSEMRLGAQSLARNCLWRQVKGSF